MAISLQKGSNISLTKTAPGLSKINVGLGWDVRTTAGADFDLDAAALLVDASGKVTSADDFIFYGHLNHPTGAVVHTGDNLTGEGDGDDEVIIVSLDVTPADTDRIVFAASIYDADARGQNFGQVRNAFIRLVNADTKEEVARYDLSEDYAVETALVFAELYRNNGEWKFRAVGQGYTNGLAGIATDFGLNIQ
tara:strand:+ start:183 stop:761 length:579 start_codon:yes stop_codon:yes gene_type:complete